MSRADTEAVGRELVGAGLLYEDLAAGDWFRTDARLVDAAMIDAFAALTGDRFEIHMDADAARRHGFERRVAHGLLILSLVDGLKNQACAQFSAIASLGWTYRFIKPVLENDVIHARTSIVAKRTTTSPDRGILTLAFDVTNQKGETVQLGENQLMVYRRSGVPIL